MECLATIDDINKGPSRNWRLINRYEKINGSRQRAWITNVRASVTALAALAPGAGAWNPNRGVVAGTGDSVRQRVHRQLEPPEVEALGLLASSAKPLCFIVLSTQVKIITAFGDMTAKGCT